MESFGELSKLTDAGEVRLVHAIGVPRSMSTAFCRAINETMTESVYVNEPFNRANNDVNQAAQFVLEAIREHATNAPPAEFVIVKNMASYLTAESFDRFNSISASNVWNIRQPLHQLESLVTRLANDLMVAPGADDLTSEEVYSHLGVVSDYLIDSPKSKNFSKTGWASIGGLFRVADKGHSVIDGEIFSSQPRTVLEQACAALSIPFADRMVEGWSADFTNVINRHDKDETGRSAWTNGASTSTGVLEGRRSGLDLDRVPQELRDHIAYVAVPTYRRLVASKV